MPNTLPRPMGFVDLSCAWDGIAVSRQQVIAQQLVELVCSLFREEDPSALQLHRGLRSRDRLGEPMGPLHRKVDVIRTSDDQGWSLQLAELRFD
jgi:hypothetical protein